MNDRTSAHAAVIQDGVARMMPPSRRACIDDHRRPHRCRLNAGMLKFAAASTKQPAIPKEAQ